MQSRKSRLFIAALTSLSLLLVAAHATRAQQASDASGWITVAPAGDSFSVSLPSAPAVKSQSALPAVGSPAGRLYATKHDSVEYRVWSLKSAQAVGDDALSVSDFLDSCAEMAWTLVISPELESAERAGSRDAFTRYGMAFVRETKTDGAQPGHYAREYSVSLGERRGRAYLFADGSQAYVALAFGRVADDASVRAFLDSFAVRTPGGDLIKMPSASAATGAMTGGGGVVGAPGRGGNTGGGSNSNTNAGSGNENTPAPSCEELSKLAFPAKEITQRAKILARPEPTYTEWARKFSVTGAVRVRGVLNANGEVTSIAAVTRLPHGLTQKALGAMHAISFEPAEKDGCKVSQYVTVDYNFNIY
jgi:TonB family protein